MNTMFNARDPSRRRPDGQGGAARAGPDGLSAVQVLLKFNRCWGLPDVLVRWAGVDASGRATRGSSWTVLPTAKEALAAFELATGRTRPRPAAPPLTPAAAAPPPVPIPNASFTVDLAHFPDLGMTLADACSTQWWPHDG